MKINEIFFSIQGEASTAGLPTIFIRMTGCNLRCFYCDTRYAYEDGEELTVDQIMARISKFPCKRVLITGGEPLMHRKELLELLEPLIAQKYYISIETNGSFTTTGLPKEVHCIIDLKTPGSGMSGLNNFENMRTARRHHDEFKFVITSKEDLSWAFENIKRHRLDKRYRCHFSPCWGKVEPAWLADQITESGLDIQLSLQLHKILWPNDEKGR